MKSPNSFKKEKVHESNPTHPLEQTSKGYTEKDFTPVSLSGMVVPWDTELCADHNFAYKLVCASGLGYFVLADDRWHKILSNYCWKEVEIVGLLNIANLTLIPQRIFPKGPKGEKENVIDLAFCKSREVSKITYQQSICSDFSSQNYSRDRRFKIYESFGEEVT